MGVLANIGRPV